MSRGWKIAIVAAVLACVAGAAALRFVPAGPRPQQPTTAPANADANRTRQPLPTLVELGSTNCIPCVQMAPMIRQLAVDYEGSLRIVSIDALADPQAAKPYDVFVMPTQVFLSADGTELFRHEGFMGRDEILDKWRELGVDLSPATRPAASQPAAEPDSPGVVARAMSAMTDAVSGSWPVALAAAALWGLLSVLLSPCHVASIPLIVGYISGQGAMTKRRAAATSAAFAGGILVTIAGVGLATYAAGRMLGDVGPAGGYVAAGVFVLVALHLLGAVDNPFSPPAKVGMKRRGIAAAALLGLAFGLILGPCTFAFLIPVIVVTIRSAATSGAWSAALMAAYGVGYASVIVLAGSSAAMVQRYLAWGEKSRVPAAMRALCGLGLLAAGLWLIYSA